jgi:hypothetical protein
MVDKSIQSYSFEELSEGIEITEDPRDFSAKVLISLFNKILKFYREDNDYPEGKVDVDPRKIVMDDKELEELIDNICSAYPKKKDTVSILLSWMDSGPSGREVEGVERGQILLKEGYMTPAEEEK